MNLTKSTGTWRVNFDAFAFESKEQAVAFEAAMQDALMSIPECRDIAATSRVICEKDDDDFIWPRPH